MRTPDKAGGGPNLRKNFPRSTRCSLPVTTQNSRTSSFQQVTESESLPRSRRIPTASGGINEQICKAGVYRGGNDALLLFLEGPASQRAAPPKKHTNRHTQTHCPRVEGFNPARRENRKQRKTRSPCATSTDQVRLRCRFIGIPFRRRASPPTTTPDVVRKTSHSRRAP